jgi:hypothetical protein
MSAAMSSTRCFHFQPLQGLIGRVIVPIVACEITIRQPQELICKMAHQNQTWGEERIAAELLLKLGIRVSPRTVRRYMPTDVGPGKRVPSRWMTFVRNHAQAIVACDFFIVVTA